MPTATAVELKPCPLYINGQPVISRGPKDVQQNPATGEAVAEIPRCTPEEISAAVEAAHRAFPSWSKTPVLQRCRVLFKYRQVLEEHAGELIALMTEENGKTLEEARGSFQRGIECIEFACGAPTLMMGETVDRWAPVWMAGLHAIRLAFALGLLRFIFRLWFGGGGLPCPLHV